MVQTFHSLSAEGHGLLPASVRGICIDWLSGTRWQIHNALYSKYHISVSYWNHNELSEQELKYSMFINNAYVLFTAGTIALKHNEQKNFELLLLYYWRFMSLSNNINDLKPLFTWMWIPVCCLPVVVLCVNMILWRALYIFSHCTFSPCSVQIPVTASFFYWLLSGKMFMVLLVVVLDM